MFPDETMFRLRKRVRLSMHYAVKATEDLLSFVHLAAYILYID